jgi:hypothetical protein
MYEEEKDQHPKAPELDRSCRALSSRWSDEEPQEGSEQEGMPRKGASMKIGDLVKVDTKHYGTKMGLIEKINEDVFGCDVAVLVMASQRRIMANPWDVEVISESR